MGSQRSLTVQPADAALPRCSLQLQLNGAIGGSDVLDAIAMSSLGARLLADKGTVATSLSRLTYEAYNPPIAERSSTGGLQ